MRKLTFLFQEPGMIEAIASEPEDEAETVRSTGRQRINGWKNGSVAMLSETVVRR